ncbi:hypothetical protein ACFRPV_33070 [Kitasatospora sp. NPDC056808]|uniref:hypothetical protein n=1 Tax=Kitasatospora sp. NPDC056789 TaxID=3345945 RepID=UPI003677E423
MLDQGDSGEDAGMADRTVLVVEQRGDNPVDSGPQVPQGALVGSVSERGAGPVVGGVEVVTERVEEDGAHRSITGIRVGEVECLGGPGVGEQRGQVRGGGGSGRKRLAGLGVEGAA